MGYLIQIILILPDMKIHTLSKTGFAGSVLAGYLLVSGCSVSRTARMNPEYSARQWLTYLASDDLVGRLPGSTGDSLARYYIRQELLRNHVSLFFHDGFQEIPFSRSRLTGENTCIVFREQTLTPGKDIALFSFSSADTVSAQVVFTGYGITQTEDSFSWNDYEGMNVHNKWVMLLRGYPPIEDSGGIHRTYWEDFDKAMLARDNGASGVIFVSGSNADREDPLVLFDSLTGSIGIPVFQIRRSIADTLLAGKNTKVALLESEMAKMKKPFSFALEDSLYAVSDIRQLKGKTYNIAGFIEGSDPVLKNEFVVIGAHYDHLGTGGRNSSSRMPDTLAVHNGADDNASGVTALLSLAEQMNRNRIRFRRSVLFVAFGGEERGLLGSKQFVASPPVDLKKIIAMINLDMVGRLDTSRGLQVSGTGTSLEADSLIRLANKSTNLKLKMSQEGFGPSDHASFYGKDIPVFFITTGAHEDYHTPFDDVEYINFQGLNQVTGFAFSLTEKIANHASGLHFREAGPKTSASASRRFKVTLGFMPDFSDQTTDGVRVEFVTKGKPADLGGIKKGDIIKAINGLAVHNIYDYMYRLSKLSAGETVSVEIMRKDTKEVLLIQL
jgi:aminopeptidase YwaD